MDRRRSVFSLRPPMCSWKHACTSPPLNVRNHPSCVRVLYLSLFATGHCGEKQGVTHLREATSGSLPLVTARARARGVQKGRQDTAANKYNQPPHRGTVSPAIGTPSTVEFGFAAATCRPMVDLEERCNLADSSTHGSTMPFHPFTHGSMSTPTKSCAALPAPRSPGRLSTKGECVRPTPNAVPPTASSTLMADKVGHNSLQSAAVDTLATGVMMGQNGDAPVFSTDGTRYTPYSQLLLSNIFVFSDSLTHVLHIVRCAYRHGAAAIPLEG